MPYYIEAIILLKKHPPKTSSDLRFRLIWDSGVFLFPRLSAQIEIFYKNEKVFAQAPLNNEWRAGVVGSPALNAIVTFNCVCRRHFISQLCGSRKSILNLGGFELARRELLPTFKVDAHITDKTTSHLWCLLTICISTSGRVNSSLAPGSNICAQ
jgi:hypothetical protein